MVDEPIDYDALEQGLKDDPAAVGVGELCEDCSKTVPKAFKYGKKIFHPAGRTHGTT